MSSSVEDTYSQFSQGCEAEVKIANDWGPAQAVMVGAWNPLSLFPLPPCLQTTKTKTSPLDT